MPDYGFAENQKNNWYISGRTPSNMMYVPITFDTNRTLGSDPISKDTPEAMVNGILYTAENGALKAVDLSTLKTKWQYTVVGTGGDFSGFAVRDKFVFAMRSPVLTVLEDMGTTYRVVWEAKSDGGSFYNLTFDDKNLYYTLSKPETGTSPGSYDLQARNALTGQLLWTYAPDIYTEILVTGANRVYMGGKLQTGLEIKAAAVDAGTGAVAWEKTVSPSGTAYQIVYSDGIVYLPVQQNEGSEIYALDAGTGDTMWKYTYRYNFRATISSEAVSVNQDAVVFLDRNDNMIALDKKSGAEKWKTIYGDGAGYFPKYETMLRPILTDKQIFLDKNYKIKVFQAATGALIREYKPYQLVANGKPPYFLLMLNEDRMVLVSYEGVFYSVSPNAFPKTKYAIQTGDTLYKISQRFNTTVDYLVLLNNMDVNARLYVGQTIDVPQIATTSYLNYVVKSGDSLYKIAQAYNTTINEIASLNNLTNVNNIYPGLTLKIPVPVVHTVAPGDTLSKIASQYNVTVQDIMQKNGISNPNLLYVGQKLLIK